jgi:hypothetical protein
MRAPLLGCVAVLFAILAADRAAAAGDYFEVSYPAATEPGELQLGVTYTLWIPEGVGRLRGVIVHQHGCGAGACKGGATAAYDLHWQALARKWDCALLGPSYQQEDAQNCRLWCDPRNGSGKTFLRALGEFAAKSRHPELDKVPWCLWGHSGGGFWASLMQTMHPDRIVAIWLRSGTAFATWEKGEIAKPEIPAAAYAVPVMCNPGAKENGDKRFSGAWDGTLAMFKAYRAQGAPIGFAPDPRTSHECGDCRYLAIPFFDACLAMRLPNKGSAEQKLKPVDMKAAWLATVLTAKAEPAAAFTGKAEEAVWLPNRQVAQAWAEYVQTGAVSDTTPPPAASNAQTERLPDQTIELTWQAEADFESGIQAFVIERDGAELARLPEKPVARFGRPLFQAMSYHDTPEQPLPEMRLVDRAPALGAKHIYSVTVVNGAGLRSPPSWARPRDPRNALNGHVIPDEGYCDQPYVVVTRDGNWLCTLTTGPGREGERGQHIVATISQDRGRTWSPPVAIEPSGEREASWVVPLVTPGGRVYAFYTFNGDNVHEMNGKPIRADTIGWYAGKYSDDHGRTWSKECFRLPLKVAACDLGNDFQGKVQIFWGIDKPNVADGQAYFAFTRLGKFMLELGEGWVFRSDNLLTEPDVGRLRWELLPAGDRGLRLPEFGSVQEEHNIVPLSSPGGFYCVYRTTLGHPCHAYSYDGCRTWTRPEFMTYAPGGRKLKTPRACPMVWRTTSGKYLFWYHHNGGKTFTGSTRNPVWVCGGVERDGKLWWSQPEILLYDPNIRRGMSYPDLIEQDGQYWVTETQKSTARVHAVDRSLLEGLWTQGQVKAVAREGLVLDAGPEQCQTGEAKLDAAVDLRKTGGMSLEVWLKLDDLTPGQAVLDARTPEGRGFALTTAADGRLQLDLNDGAAKTAWDTDPGLLRPGQRHHVVAICDAEANVLSFVVDGQVCDGGEGRECGWGRLPPGLGEVTGTGSVRVAPAVRGGLARLRVYGRHLRTSEAVANYHAGP